MSSIDDTTTTETDSTIDHTDLLAFQENILVVTASLERDDERVYGLAIKERLDALYGHNINHGRLYTNLDELVGEGLMEKGQLDQRTNSYHLTERGRELLEERRDQLMQVLGGELA